MIGPVFACAYSIWDDLQSDAANVGWLRQTSDAVMPAAIGHYVGEADLERPERLRGAYTPDALAKLKRLQKRYDPKGIFRRSSAAALAAPAPADGVPCVCWRGGLTRNVRSLLTSVRRRARLFLRLAFNTLNLAGAGGIEPPNGGIKIRCLTAWRRPISVENDRDEAAPTAVARTIAARPCPINASKDRFIPLISRRFARRGAGPLTGAPARLDCRP